MKFIAFTAVIAFLTSCVSEKKVGEILKKNPKLLTDAIRANPEEFMLAIQDAARDAREGLAKKREEEEKKKLEQFFDKPLKPNIKGRITRGAPAGKGKIVLVEYSDFQCPYCTKGYNTVNDLLKKYKDKITFVYKHLPLSFHKEAKPASQYFEAIAKQSPKKAWEFHDKIFQSQEKLRLGEKFLKGLVKKIGGIDLKKLAKDVKSKEITKRIEEDIAEANKFKIQGTPGFLLNGVPVKGAYPTDYFVQLIDTMVKKGKLKL